MCEAEKLQTSHEILAYLAENPDAEDTLEGVVEWWLLEQRIRNRAVRVEEALAELVASGLVLERKGRDLRSHYRINPGKLAEVSARLRNRPGVIRL